MSRTVAAETAYYQTIEEFFVSRRGDPLFVSHSDWLLIHSWKTEGLPLRVVLRGIADALDGHAHSWSRRRKVGSLAFCRAEVEAARERWQRALQLGEEPGLDKRDQLLALAEELLRAKGLRDAAARLASEIAAELRLMAEAEPRHSLEARLQQREADLRAALTLEVDPQLLARHEAAIERDLAPYKERMPRKVLEQIREEARTRRLFEACGLPRLSLFAL